MAWIARKVRGKRKEETDGKFRVSTLLDELAEEGFRPLIKADVLDSRRKSIDEELARLLVAVNNPTKKDEEKGEAVDQLMQLTFLVASPWLRSMDNAWLSHKINCFVQNYREWRTMPEFYDHLVEEALAIINLAFTNIDVEPLKPLIIQTQPQYGGGFGQTLPSSGWRVSETYPSEMVKRPKGGPYPKQLDTDVKEQGEE